MTKVLITGATGNVGLEVIKSLKTIDHQLEIYAGVRNLGEDSIKLSSYNVNFSLFDFADATTYNSALDGCELLFLIRPPQISDVQKYFNPIIETCRAKDVKHIVFLSVQGAEKNKIIPHHKIEKLIVDSKIPYTFLRPAYFMQNFTTTLQNDIVHQKRIYLPAGNAKFTLIDVRDIGSVSATILTEVSQHINKSYTLTCKDTLSFSDMARIMSKILGTDIQYKSPNLISFFLAKRKEKTPSILILVMIMLHYLPRFQHVPETTDWVTQILGRLPTTFVQFVVDHRNLLK